MWQQRVIYILATILLAYVDKVRIKSTWGRVANIDKRLSWTLGAIAAVITYLYCHDWRSNIDWDWTFFLECIALRGMFYDAALNLFNREKIDKVSRTTNSKIDHKEWKLFNTFWQEKLAYTIIEIVLIIFSYLV